MGWWFQCFIKCSVMGEFWLFWMSFLISPFLLCHHEHTLFISKRRLYLTKIWWESQPALFLLPVVTVPSLEEVQTVELLVREQQMYVQHMNVKGVERDTDLEYTAFLAYESLHAQWYTKYVVWIWSTHSLLSKVPLLLLCHLKIIINLCVWVCRRFSESGEKGWFRSLFVHKVDARKDAHSNLLSKTETSSLFKMQCKLPSSIYMHGMVICTWLFQLNV